MREHARWTTGNVRCRRFFQDVLLHSQQKLPLGDGVFLGNDPSIVSSNLTRCFLEPASPCSVRMAAQNKALWNSALCGVYLPVASKLNGEALPRHIWMLCFSPSKAVCPPPFLLQSVTSNYFMLTVTGLGYNRVEFFYPVVVVNKPDVILREMKYFLF